MSTLKLQANPFLVHGRSQSDNNYLNNSKSNEVYHLDMPRTYSPPLNVSTPYFDRKRKFDEDLLITPEHSNKHETLITPPRSYKRSKTVPSSPVNNHDIYETPKTPSFKQDVLINLGTSSLNHLPKSPEYRPSPAYRITENVTPPQSTSGSPRQASATITSPTVLPSRRSQGNEYAYLYADTCYPFNIGGSAIGRSEGNLRLKTWREACNEKVRHEYNKALKDYNAFSTTLAQAAKNRMDGTSIDPPTLFDEKIFPSAAHLSKIAYKQLNYPFAGQVDNSQENIEYEAQLLLGLRNQSHNVPPKADYPLKHCSDIKLPPISEILKYTPFDKSTVHPSGLSTLEIHQYQNSEFPGIVFNRTSEQFYNGREIRKNLPVQSAEDFNSKVQDSYQPTGILHHSAQQSHVQVSNPMPYRGPYKAHASYCPSTIPSITIDNDSEVEPTQLKSPIRLKPLRSQGANAYDALNKELKNLSDDEKTRNANLGKTIKQFQTQFKTQPLKVTKTRRNSVFKSKKDTFSPPQVKRRRDSSSSSSSTTSTSSRPHSRPPSRTSNRKLSFSGPSSLSASKNEETVSNTTAVYRPRTRSSSRSRCSSSESIKTAEIPASVETTPKSSPVVQKTQGYAAKTASLLFPSYDSSSDKKTLDFSKSTILCVVPMKAQMPIAKLPNESHHNHKHNHNHNHSNVHQLQHSSPAHQQQQNRAKKCMSCFSSLSPCWRPSWAPDEGQLCNSCGLRYRKTKARCYNPSCLKIPSKSEWALMVKRGEVLLDIYDSQGNVIGKKMSYRCLDCDSAMEVSR